MQPRRSSALASLLMGIAGCLPEAGPGIGERVVEGRGFADVGFSRGDWILYTQAAPASGEHEGDGLFGPNRSLLAVRQDGGQPRVIATQLVRFWRAQISWDARGRLLIPNHPVSIWSALAFTLTRLDLASGAEEQLDMARAFHLSPDRETLIVEQPDGTLVARGPDERTHVLGRGVREGRFLGADLYYVNKDGLWRLRPLAEAPELLMNNVLAWRPIPGAEIGGAVMVIGWGSAFERRWLGVLQPAGRRTQMIAEGHFLGAPVLSPDGQRVAAIERTSEPNRFRLRVVTLATNAEESAEIVLPTTTPREPPLSIGQTDLESMNAAIAFRPASPEVWYFIHGRLSAVQTGLTVRVPSRDRFVAPFVRPPVPQPPIIGEGDTWDGSIFTSSGRRWVFMDGNGRSHLADADDLEGTGALALGHFHQLGNETIREVEGGRWLVVRATPGEDRSDLTLVDPEAMTARVLGRNLGRMGGRGRRLVAIVDKMKDWWSPGRLMAYDLETGGETVLARNATDFDLEPACAGCDPTAPGARLLYLVHARVPIPHDGLWQAVVP